MYSVTTKIQYKKFGKKIKGYSTDEVDEFLDEICDDFNQLSLDKNKADRKVEELEEKIRGMLGMETAIQKALMLAQNVAAEAKNSGEREVSVMITEANELAKRTVDEALREREKIENDIERLKMAFNSYKRRILDFMSMQQDDFEDNMLQLERPANVEPLDISSNFSEDVGLIKG